MLWWIIISVTALLVALGGFALLMWRAVESAREEQDAHEELWPGLLAAGAQVRLATEGAADASAKDPLAMQLAQVEGEVDGLKDRIALLGDQITSALSGKQGALATARKGVAGRTDELSKSLATSVKRVNDELQGRVKDLEAKLTALLTETSGTHDNEYFVRANAAFTALKQVHGILPSLDAVQVVLLDGGLKSDQVLVRIGEHLSPAQLGVISGEMSATIDGLTSDLSAHDASLAAIATLASSEPAGSACDSLLTSATALDHRVQGSESSVVVDQLCFMTSAGDKCLTRAQLSQKLSANGM